jgi:hypothetical protein
MKIINWSFIFFFYLLLGASFCVSSFIKILSEGAFMEATKDACVGGING